MYAAVLQPITLAVAGALCLLAAWAFAKVSGRRTASRSSLLSARGERGQSLVEMAILLPLFLVLLVGIVEVANGLNTYLTVVNSARDGARLASKGGADDTAVRNLVVAETDRLRAAVQPGSDVAINYIQVDGVDAVEVTVCNDHKLLLGVPLVMSDTYRMCSSTAMRLFDPAAK